MIEMHNENIPGKSWLAMVFLALLVSFSFQGSRGLYETSEGRYAECAREMIESGNYLEPTLGYRPHWAKPPLTYWAIAGGIKLLGPSEWGVRFYNVIAFFFTVLAVAYIGATLWDKTTGLMAGLIYVSSPFPVFGAYAVTTDTLLTLWEVSAVLCYIKAYHAMSSAEGKRWIAAMWISFGLGFLTKGPAVLLPLIPVLIWHFQHKPQISVISPLGILLFILAGFSWYLLVCLRHPGLMSYFLGHEIIDRVTSNSVHNHEWYKPFVVYLSVLTLGAGPWLYFGLRVLWQKRIISPTVLRSHLRKGSKGSFLLLWLLLPLIIFCLVKSRLELYVLPIYAPIVLAIARGIYTGAGRTGALRRVVIISVLTAFTLAGLKGVTSYSFNKKDMKALYKLCREVGRDDTRFVSFNRSKLYGLQYYLNGDLRRTSLTGREAWADGSIQEDIRKIRGPGSSRSYVFITDKKEAHGLCNILKESGIDFQRFHDRYWVTCLAEKEAPKSCMPKRL